MRDLPKSLVMPLYDYAVAYSPKTVRKAGKQVCALTTACENNEVFFQIMASFPTDSAEFQFAEAEAKYIMQMALRVNKLFKAKE
jgi:hypothetical protein